MRFGLVGCGEIGSLRADTLRDADGVVLAAACDIDEARVLRLSRAYDAPSLPCLSEMVESVDLDGVIISTPPAFHPDLAVSALEAGLHVLCEKPLARTASEYSDIVAAAERADRLACTGFNYRFYPSVRKARELLDSGAIGELKHIRGYTGYSAEEHGQPWLRDPDETGGGALRDNGVHLIDLLGHFPRERSRRRAGGRRTASGGSKVPKTTVFSCSAPTPAGAALSTRAGLSGTTTNSGWISSVRRGVCGSSASP